MIEDSNFLFVGSVLLFIASVSMLARRIYLKKKMDYKKTLKSTSRYYPRTQWGKFEFVCKRDKITVFENGKEIKYINYIEIDCDGMRIERLVEKEG